MAEALVTKSYTVASDKTHYESFAVHIQITDIDTSLYTSKRHYDGNEK